MNGTRTDQFCTIERTPGRIRLLIRHEPALLPGFAREVASRLNQARERPERGQIYFVK